MHSRRDLTGASTHADCLSTEERADRHMAELTATKGGHEAGPEWSAEGIHVLVAEGSPAQERYNELWEEADPTSRRKLERTVLVLPAPSSDDLRDEPRRCPHCGGAGADVFSHDCYWAQARRSRQLGLYELARRRTVSRPRGAARPSRGRPIRRRGSRRTSATRAGPDDSSDSSDPDGDGEHHPPLAAGDHRREALLTDSRGQSVAEWRTPQAIAYLAVMALRDLADELRRHHGLSQAEADAVVLETYAAWHREQRGGRR